MEITVKKAFKGTIPKNEKEAANMLLDLCKQETINEKKRKLSKFKAVAFILAVIVILVSLMTVICQQAARASDDQGSGVLQISTPGHEFTGFITIRDVRYSASLTELDLSGRDLRNEDIVPLKHMTSLTNLNLSHNQISDITPLYGLANLTELNLRNNQISDIAPLSGLTNLTRLDLGSSWPVRSNKITDITPLSNLTNLTELDLYGNQISDVAPLSGLANLTNLGLSSNQVSDISQLSALTNLISLHIFQNRISDITPLSGLANLTKLDLHGNQINDVTSLSVLTNLTMLYLGSNQINDVTPLSELANLRQLSLRSNQISDISPLSELVNLRLLHLDSNLISDITPLSGFTHLEVLFLSNNQITDIATLSNLASLKSLILDNNQISDVTPLPGLTNQRMDLNLSDNPIADQSAVEHIYHVRSRRGLDFLIHDTNFTVVLFLIVALSFYALLVIPPFIKWKRQNELVKHGYFVSGRAENIVETIKYPLFFINHRYLDVSFEWEGEMHKLTTLIPADKDRYPVGSEVELLYLPKYAKSVMINDGSTISVLRLAFIILMASLLALMVINLVTGHYFGFDIFRFIVQP